MSYRVKEMFYSLQGEGAQSGRASLFCRFSRCNLWSGREQDRAQAICNFCDTDIRGTDGQNGGIFPSAQALAKAAASLWPSKPNGESWLVCTGGEPLLQLDEELIGAFHDEGFLVAVETNGTQTAPKGLDWICISPKGKARPVLSRCNELKLVYPQVDAPPEAFDDIICDYRFLSPMADPRWIEGADPIKDKHTQQALRYCLEHPQWRLTLQSHKLLNID